MGIENPVHLLFIAIVALVVLGPKRLPELARALGKGMREFRQAMSGGEPRTERGRARRAARRDSWAAAGCESVWPWPRRLPTHVISPIRPIMPTPIARQPP